MARIYFGITSSGVYIRESERQKAREDSKKYKLLAELIQALCQYKIEKSR